MPGQREGLALFKLINDTKMDLAKFKSRGYYQLLSSQIALLGASGNNKIE